LENSSIHNNPELTSVCVLLVLSVFDPSRSARYKTYPIITAKKKKKKTHSFIRNGDMRIFKKSLYGIEIQPYRRHECNETAPKDMKCYECCE